MVKFRESAGSPVVRTPCFHCRGHRFQPWTKSMQVVQLKKKILKLIQNIKKKVSQFFILKSEVHKRPLKSQKGIIYSKF